MIHLTKKYIYLFIFLNSSSSTFAACNLPHAGIACGGGTAGAQGAVEGHASAPGGEAAAAGGAETAGQGEGAGAGDVLLATDT